MLLSRIDLEEEYFLRPHLWQRGGQSAASRPTGPLWPGAVRGGRRRATGQEMHTYLRACGIGFTDRVVNKRREKVHERRMEEGAHEDNA